MGRLVDADKLLNAWNSMPSRSRDSFDQVIMTMPTAFDKDKVLEELEKYAHTFDYGEKGCDNALVVYKCRNIVREGGVE